MIDKTTTVSKTKLQKEEHQCATQSGSRPRCANVQLSFLHTLFARCSFWPPSCSATGAFAACKPLLSVGSSGCGVAAAEDGACAWWTPAARWLLRRLFPLIRFRHLRSADG